MRSLLIVFIAFYSTTLLGQSSHWTALYTIDAKAQQCYLDPLNRAYLVKKGEVELRDEKNKVLSIYSNKLIGEDIMLDATNPLKILVYSPNQMKLIFLDSRLAELREPINLFAKGFEQISLAATSHSNGFWLYDPINFQLIRFDQNSEEERRSLNLGQLLRLELYPTDMVEQANKVYMTDPAHGVFVFDVYGNYLNLLPIKGIEHLVIHNDRLFYKKDDALLAYHLIDQREEKVDIELGKTLFFDVNRSRIIGAEKNRVLIFTTAN